MRKRGTELSGWKWALLGVFGALASIGAVSGLISKPAATAESFAALALLALFLPLTGIAVTHIPAIGRHLGGPVKASDPHVAVILLGGVTVAFVAGAISGAYAWFVDGVTEFETGSARYVVPVPLFVVGSVIAALASGALTVRLMVANRRRRSRRR